MSFSKTGAIAGLALLLGGVAAANAAVVDPNLGRSPRATESYSTYQSSAAQNAIDYGQTGSIGTASVDPAPGQADPYAHCLGQSPRAVSAYSCQY